MLKIYKSSMRVQKIREGAVEIDVPVGRKYDAPVFYNKDGEFTRDISIAAIQAFQRSFKKKIEICDALSASGAAGLRYGKEIKHVKKVTLNDKNPVAVKLIKNNISHNKCRNCSAVKSDANILMRQNVYHVIDIDPFGPPVQFLDSCARSIYHNGFVAITATDQSALSGSFPKSCLRKYGIRSMRTEFYNELGIRILISAIILAMARYDRAFIPVLAFPYKHYYRIFGKIKHAGYIEKILDEFDYVSYDKKTGERSFGKPQSKTCGLIYLGKINDPKFIKEVIDEIEKRDFRLKNQELKILRSLKQEADIAPFYYDVHHLSKIYKFPIPKFDEIIKRLKKKRFKASRTIFSEKSIRTNASLKQLLKVLKS